MGRRVADGAARHLTCTTRWPRCARCGEDEERRIRAIVNRLGPEGIARPIEYQGWDGRRQAQPFWQMLQHLVNHGSYHRGQVTTMLRQMNVPPPKSMDLIAFYRERAQRDGVVSGFSRTALPP